MKQFIFFLTIIFLNNSILFADEIKIKQKYEDAEYQYLNNEYKDALENYLSILNIDSNNYNVHYKAALCYLQLDKNNNSLRHIEIAVKGVDKDYKNHYKELNAPTLAWLYYGDVLRLSYKFNDAIDAYNKYIELEANHKQNKDYLNREINNCKSAVSIIDNKITLTEASYNNEIKKKDKVESCPVISQDENILVFAFGENNILPPDIISISDVDEYKTDDIYCSIKENGEWNNAINITEDLGVSSQALVTSISSEGDVLYLAQDDDDDGNIYKSYYVDGKWSIIEKLNKNISSNSWETFASISGDNKKLYFASDRKGGYGGFDIYVSILDKNGEWGKAKNLGSEINTKYDEDTPNITRDGKSLYFCSQGHLNLGGFDIFHSELKDSLWSEAKNVGYPLNTPGNDLFVLTQYNNQLAFAPLNDDRLRGFSGEDESQLFFISEEEDIYNIKVIVSINGSPDSLITNLEADTNSSNISDYLVTDNVISFKMKKDSFKIPVRALNTDTVMLSIAINDDDSSEITKEYNINLTLAPILAVTDTPNDQNNNEIGIVAVIPVAAKKDEIKTIYFSFDKSFIKEKFNTDVKEIYSLWLNDKTNTIIIEGYADSVGPELYNQKLSQRRADTVKNYLISLGVDKNKINPIGKGETNESSNNYYNRKTVIYLNK